MSDAPQQDHTEDAPAPAEIPAAEPAPPMHPHLSALITSLEAIAHGFAHLADASPAGSLGPLGRIARELRGHAETLKTPAE